MFLKFALFIFIFVVAIISLCVFKKIEPDSFGLYLIWVLFILAIALVLYRPWMILV